MRRQFHSKIGVIAGNRSHDYKGADLIRTVKSINADAQFFGLGGAKMAQADREFKNYGSLDKLIDKPFFPQFNIDLDRSSPLYIPLIYSNVKILRSMYELHSNGFFKNFEYDNSKEVDMVITLGNELFARRVLNRVSSICTKNNQIKPLTIHVDALKRNFIYDDISILDFCVHTIQKDSADRKQFAFPSQFIGKQVVFDALSFIYKQNPKYSEFVSGSLLKINPEMNVLAVEEIAFQMRNDFREKHFFSDSSYLFFISPGNEESEIRANVKVAAEGIKIFLKKFSEDNRFTKKNFGVVLSLPEEFRNLKDQFPDLIAADIATHFVFGNEDGERYRAMAACDLAAVANGDSVFESSVFQLPTVILDNSSFLSAYFKLMYNVYGSEFNWNAAGETLPETLGRNFGAKVSEFWENWFISPKSRFKLARKTNRQLFHLLPQIQHLRKGGIEEWEERGDAQSFINPNLVFERFLEEVYVGFQDVKHKSASAFEKTRSRRVLVHGPEFA